jgi:lysozyme family protein
MKSNYIPFITRVINNYERGYGWDKNDAGGPTKYGITCFDLAEHRHNSMNSMAVWAPRVQAMSLQEAEDIYDSKYANGLYFDALRSGPDCCILDYGINSGVARPFRVARALLKFTDPSNVALIKAINAADPKWFVDAMCQERLQFMHAIRGGSAWATFGGGWGKRVADLNAYCDRLAAGGTGAIFPPAAPTVPHPKVTHGHPDDITGTLSKTAGGAVVGGATAHFAGAPPWLLPVVVGGVVIAGLAFAYYEGRKNALANRTVVIPPTVPPQPPTVPPVTTAVTGATGVSKAA